MTEPNPYAAPTVDEPLIVEATGLRGLSFQQLKKLYYRSSNLNVINFLTLIGVISLVVIIFAGMMEEFYLTNGIILGVCVVYTVSFIGLYVRPKWGRVAGIIVCAMMLLSIPIGTIVGIVGLVALIKAPELFGPDRVTHRELKTEFKAQKAAHKLAKKASRA